MVLVSQSVLGGWQTMIKETGVMIGPVFNDTTELWRWQGTNLFGSVPKDKLDPSLDQYLKVSFDDGATWKVVLSGAKLMYPQKKHENGSVENLECLVTAEQISVTKGVIGDQFSDLEQGYIPSDKLICCAQDFNLF